jgi:hypothetical protein
MSGWELVGWGEGGTVGDATIMHQQLIQLPVPSGPNVELQALPFDINVFRVNG